MIAKDIKVKYLILLVIGAFMPVISFLSISFRELVYLDIAIKLFYCVVLCSLYKLNADVRIASFLKAIGALSLIAPLIMFHFDFSDQNGIELLLDGLFRFIGSSALVLGFMLIGYIGDILEYLTQIKIVSDYDQKLAKGWKRMIYFQSVPFVVLVVCAMCTLGIYQLGAIIILGYIALYFYQIVKIYYLFKTYRLFKKL